MRTIELALFTIAMAVGGLVFDSVGLDAAAKLCLTIAAGGLIVTAVDTFFF